MTNTKKRKRKLELKKVLVNEETFYKILNSTNLQKEKVDNIYKYSCGYPERHTIRYTTRPGEEALICRQNFLVACGVLPLDELDLDMDWYQVMCVMNKKQLKSIRRSMSPVQACKKMMSILHKHYTDEDIHRIYEEHEAESSSIIHTSLICEQYEITRFDNCYYYDANGAYASQLIKLFPECREELEYMFEHRHDNDNYFKNLFNYFVGCLTQNENKRQALIDAGKEPRVIYPKTRHYIVNNVTEMLDQLSIKLNSELTIYANTDGLVVQNPHNILESFKDIGTFKIEYQGHVYTYAGRNYTIMQFGDDPGEDGENLKGSLPICLRNKVDLSKGKVVEYERVLNVEDGYYEYKNIKEIQLAYGN